MSVTHRQLITELHQAGNGPKAIHEALKRQVAHHNQDLAALSQEREDLPSLRTVQRFVREELIPEDDSAPWTLADADPKDAALVIEVAAQMFVVTSGRDWPSKDLADEIVRIRTAVPDVPLDWAWYCAGAYQLRRDKGRDTRHLDVVLGLRPWANPSAATRLSAAFLANDPHIAGWDHAQRLGKWTGDARDIDRLLTMTVSYVGSFPTFRSLMLSTDPAGGFVAGGRRAIAEQWEDLVYNVRSAQLEHGDFTGDFK